MPIIFIAAGNAKTQTIFYYQGQSSPCSVMEFGFFQLLYAKA
jgi:hypothetical protein